MFYGYVITGNSTKMNHDKTLRMPPKIPGTKDFYDSVNGKTKGSKVYMIYDNDRSYP
jgi:hypothetical protein